MDIQYSSNDNVSLLKALLQWLANCSIKDSLYYIHDWFSSYLKHAESMHIIVLR